MSADQALDAPPDRVVSNDQKSVPFACSTATLALVAATIIWGGTYVAVKQGTVHIPPYSFNAARFLVAGLVLAACCGSGKMHLGVRGLLHSTALGTCLFAAYALLTLGLQTSPTGRAAFITGMFVVFVPLFTGLTCRRRPATTTLMAVGVACVGLALLTLRGAWLPAGHDVLILGCALCLAVHITGLEKWSGRYAALPFTAAQLTIAGSLHTMVAAATEVPSATYHWNQSAVTAIAVTALLASGAAFWLQTLGQQSLSANRAAVILTLEPVCAAVTGRVLLGERLTLVQLVGCGLVLTATCITEAGHVLPAPISPEFQRFTRRDSRTIPLIDFAGLVESAVLSRLLVFPKRMMVRCFETLAQQRGTIRPHAVFVNAGREGREDVFE